MNYEERWMVLSKQLIELQEKGIIIPPNVKNDLRSAKTMIQILKLEPNHQENIRKMDLYMTNVEFYTIFISEKLGLDTTKDWMKKIIDSNKVKNKKNKSSTSFITGIPRDKKCLRIKTSKDIPLEEVKKFLKRSNLNYKIQENCHILVYGNEEEIKIFVNNFKNKFRKSRNG